MDNITQQKGISTESHKRTIAVVALGLWSASLTIGALRVILPVYFASVGVSISKIAFLFFFDALAQTLAPVVIGLTINRLGYRRSLLGGLGLHSLISFMYIFDPAFVLIYLERFVRGLITMPLLSEVYVKHFSPKESQPHHINMMLGFRDVAKGIGMFVGGALIAFFPFRYSIAVFGLLTTVAAVTALLYLPDLREQARTPLLKIWGAVDPKIKTLGLSRGFLQGAEDGWASAILPVYLTVVFGLSPTLVGAVMMAGLIFYGANVGFLSRWLITGWDSRKALIISALLLLPVCLSLSLPMSVYLFLLLICLYQLLNGACAVYQNHLKLEFATKENTSIDLAAFKTLSNVFKPVAVFVAGVLADTMGFSWAFYFSSLLILFCALTCLALPQAGAQAAAVAGRSYGGELVTVKK
ncbi:MAG: MFS transporter [Deltaproteobacteria bacterium]|nr:MFS transporter [Deltaproteobacteria bacterium]